MENNIFLIHTPFQLMNCLNIIGNNFINDKNDIVLLHKNLPQYIPLINKYNKKINVFVYDNLFENHIYSNKLLIRISLIKNMINGKKDINSVSNREQKYTNIFVPSENIACNIIYNFFKNKNKNIKLNVFDDGVGTYAEGYIDGKKHLLYRVVSWFLYGSFFWKDIKRVYCYQPELVHDPLGKVEKNKIVSEKEVEQLYSMKVSEDLIEKYIKSKFIYLDQGSLQLSNDIINSFFGQYNKYFNSSQVIFKNHPRLKPGHNINNVEVDNSGNSLESIFLKIDIEEKVLVSMYSTSCLTPYILKGIYPYIIFLGNLNTNIYESYFKRKYFINVISKYPKDKVFIPRNVTELENAIKYIYEKM